MTKIDCEDNEVFIRNNFYKDLQNAKQKYVHIIMIATKPDIVKQAPIYLELKKRWELVILVHTGQHYDYNLSKWVLAEFWMEVDINLNIFWEITKKYSLIVERLWEFLKTLQEDYKKIPVPYVHGDTMTAATADKASFLSKVSVVHVEAWIRTYTPNKYFYYKLFLDYEAWKFDFDKYRKSLKDETIYELGSIEPYPEQFCTRWIEPSSWFFAAPVEFNKKTLIAEWFPRENIKVVWNTTSDAIEISMKKVKNSRAFEKFPNMKWKKFIFVTIHRRENTQKKERFLAIYYALKKLVMEGIPVCFLWLYASEWAIDNYWLRADIEKLVKDYPDNFAYGPALAHHSEVIDMISRAWAIVSDSGSMQEEGSVLGVPYVTVRFWSDRSETILDGQNVLAPPINSGLIVEIIKWAIWNKKMIKKSLYWKNVSKKIVDWVLEVLKNQWKLFRFDDERLDLWQFFNWKI